MSEEIPLRLDAIICEHGPETSRPPVPINGWPLDPLMRLDRAGARGLVSDLIVAGPLTRQAAFVAAAAILERGEGVIDALIASFTVVETGAEAAGRILRRPRAREIIAAVYGVRPTAVPGGFLRALQRIQEARSPAPGLDPFADPGAYHRLFEIMSSGRRGPVVQALRYVGPLRAMYLRAVDELDPVLVVPEVLRTMYGPDKIQQANAMLALLRRCVSDLDDATLTLALQQSLGHGDDDALGRLGRRVLERADRLPVPDLPHLDGLHVLASADELRAFGTRMDNCAGHYVVEVALGTKLVVAYTHVDQDGVPLTLAIVLAPMVSGLWQIEQILGCDNDPVPRPVLQTVLRRLMSIGIQLPGPALGSTYDRDVSELLGVHPLYGTRDRLRAALVRDDVEEITEGGVDDMLSALDRMAEPV